jgi:hypothetical protein
MDRAVLANSLRSPCASAPRQPAESATHTTLLSFTMICGTPAAGPD